MPQLFPVYVDLKIYCELQKVRHEELERNDQEIKDDFGEAVGKNEPMNWSEPRDESFGKSATKKDKWSQRKCKRELFRRENRFKKKSLRAEGK